MKGTPKGGQYSVASRDVVCELVSGRRGVVT
jgi:hypothetical protein